jgi:hypothetical protein
MPNNRLVPTPGATRLFESKHFRVGAAQFRVRRCSVLMTRKRIFVVGVGLVVVVAAALVLLWPASTSKFRGNDRMDNSIAEIVKLDVNGTEHRAARGSL